MTNNTTPDGVDDEEMMLLKVLHIFYWEQILTAVVIAVIAITGLVGNSMIIAAVAFSKKLFTPTNAFVTSLSAADLLTSFALIWYTVGSLGKGEWPLSGAHWLCQFSAFTVYACIGTSMWTLGLIAVNRLIHIVKPFWYRKIFASWKLGILVAIPWIIPSSTFLILQACGYVSFGYDKLALVCTEFKNTPQSIYGQTIVGLLLPLISIMGSYIWIYVYVRRHSLKRQHNVEEYSMDTSNTTDDFNSGGTTPSKRPRISSRKIQITKNLFMIFCAFSICFLPYFALRAIEVVSNSNIKHYMFYVKILPFANSAINFIIYASKHPDFKVVLRCMMKCSYADIPQPSPILKYLLSKKN